MYSPPLTRFFPDIFVVSSSVSQLALHLHDFRRKFCTHYLFSMHTTCPAHHMLLCFINVAVFGGETNIEAHYYVSYLQHSATWPIRTSVYLLPIEQWDRGFEFWAVLKRTVCLRLLCLCCAVSVSALRRADTPSKESCHMHMNKLYKPYKAALVCSVIRTDSWYRHCPFSSCS
jgi:hypothetical protein